MFFIFAKGCFWTTTMANIFILRQITLNLLQFGLAIGCEHWAWPMPNAQYDGEYRKKTDDPFLVRNEICSCPRNRKLTIRKSDIRWNIELKIFRQNRIGLRSEIERNWFERSKFYSNYYAKYVRYRIACFGKFVFKLNLSAIFQIRWRNKPRKEQMKQKVIWEEKKCVNFNDVGHRVKRVNPNNFIGTRIKRTRNSQLYVICDVEFYWKITPHTRSIGINTHDMCERESERAREKERTQYNLFQSGIYSPAPRKHFDVFLDSQFLNIVLVDAVSFEIR